MCWAASVVLKVFSRGKNFVSYIGETGVQKPLDAVMIRNRIPRPKHGALALLNPLASVITSVDMGPRWLFVDNCPITY